jgi:hypothetical protein
MDSAYEKWYNYFLGQLGGGGISAENDEYAGYIENYDPRTDSVVRKPQTPGERLMNDLFNLNKYNQY